MRILFMFLLLSLVAACSSDKDTKLDEVNLAPVITMPSSMSAEEATSVTLSATVDDPEKDALSYLWVLLEGQVSFSGETTNSPTVELPYLNELASTRFLFELTVTDSAGNSASQRLELLVTPNSQNLYAMDFLDSNFKSCVMKNAEANNWYYTTDVTKLVCNVDNDDYSTAIKLTNELNLFENLTHLDLDQNAISHIELDSLAKLENLSLQNNTIKNITFSDSISNLKRLSIGQNWYLRELDLSALSSLQELVLKHTMVKELLLPSNSKLEVLRLQHEHGNENLNIVIPDLPKLKELYVRPSLYAESITLKSLNSLEILELYGVPVNGISELDLSNLQSLKLAYIDANFLEKIAFNEGAPLEKLQLLNKQGLVEVTLPKTNVLEELALAGLGLSEVDLSHFINLKSLSLDRFDQPIEPSGVEYLNLSGLKSLEYLHLDSLRLKSLDLSEQNLLSELVIFAPISELDLANQTQLTKLHLNTYKTEFKSVDVNHLTGLTSLKLELYRTQDVEINKLENLTTLNLSDVAMADLNLEVQSRLESLTLSYCGFKSLSVLPQTPLKKVSIYNCLKLNTDILHSVNSLKSLEELSLSGNQIDKVINFELPKLTYIELSDNAIETINIDELPSLETLYIHQNPLSEQTRAYLKAKAEEVGFSLHL